MAPCEGGEVRLRLPFILLITLWLAFSLATVQAAGSGTHLSRQLELYYSLQQHIARPGDISEEGLSGLKLLLAQLYTEMGMLLSAEKTLNELEGGPSVQQLRDMGRLLLARQYRLRGEMEAAQSQLNAIGSGLDMLLDNERQQMLALSAVERGDSDEALRRFAAVQGGEGAVLLARFNYATLLMQRGGQEHGLILLQELAAYPAEAPAVSALRDRANLLLGYFYLQRQQYQEAERFLREVALEGPYSRAAMLAQGWVELALRGPEYAMVPWLELQAAGVDDSLAEETELAIAAAVAAKGASQRVLDLYTRMIERFEEGRRQVAQEQQRHARPYPPQAIAAVLEREGGAIARTSVPAVTLRRLLALQQEMVQGAGLREVDWPDEADFFEKLWPRLHALYPEPDESSGIGVAAHVAQRTEGYIRTFLQSSPRAPRPAPDFRARLDADHATMDGEIAVVAEWYRRSRLEELQARDRRLTAYMERARLAIARNHDMALRRQERE